MTDKQSLRDDEYEASLIKEADKATTQWRLPSPRTFAKAIFWSDHYSWMWKPSSVIFILLSYLVVRYCQVHYYEWNYAMAFGMVLPPIVVYWALGTTFYVLDKVSGQEGKEFKTRTTVPIMKILAIVARNHMLTLVVAPFVIFNTYAMLSPSGKMLDTAQDGIVWFLWSYFIDGMIYEAVFWSGHYLEHLSPKLYRDFHLLHHTTKSDLAFSGWYMTVMDYCLEGMIPMYCCLLATTKFQLSSVAMFTTCTMNFAYAATIHSGWAIPGFPDPGDHWLHHSKVAPRGQGINYGTHFVLMDAAMETHEAFNAEARIGKKKK